MATEIESAGENEAPPEAHEAELTPSEREELVTKKATCPFLGSAIATGELPVRNVPGNPLASVQDVIALGNAGGGDLGKVLGFFASGNHGKMRGPAGNLDTPVPPGLFSLDLPGSQGSHAGHSGILQGDPTQLDSGRFSESDFQRLVDMSHDGFIKRSEIGRFIAQNLKRDSNIKLLPLAKWAKEAVDLSKAVFRRFGKRDQGDSVDAEIQRSLASIAGGNHLLGSAGEFGLLLAFLHNSPRTRHEKEPAFSMAEITAMFKDKELPEGWQTWKKTARDWVNHTLKLASSAAVELVKLKL
jgi:hypothetical protein